MSVGAAEYYSEIASRFGDTQIPEILSGESYVLGIEGQRVSVGTLGMPAEIADHYADAISVAGTFALDHSGIEPPQPDEFGFLQTGSDAHQHIMLELGRDKYVEALPRHLIPKKIPGSQNKLVTGHIRDLRIEAVTPDDLPEGIFNRATDKYSDAREYSSNVLFVESAELVLGRTLGRVANLTVVAADHRHWRLYRTLGAPYKQNELLAASGMWQSEATATYVDSVGLSRQIVQNVGRGKGQR